MKKNFLKIVSIVLTMLMLVGTMTIIVPLTASAEEAEPIYLEKNKTATINGITYRFDTDTSKNPDSWARVNPDGTWEISYRSGDILWFPDVELTADSEVRMDVTNTAEVAMEKVVSGLAYAVTANSDGRADKMVIVNTHTGGRVRFANSNYTSNNTPTPNDGFNGGGGASDKITIYAKDTSTWKDTAAWTDVKNINDCLAVGKTVTYSVKKNADGNAVASYGAHYYNFVSKTLSASTYAFEGGAVGFTATYSYNESYAQTKISNLLVRNCKVDGEKVEGFSIFGEVVKPHTDIEVDGKIYRFDPLAVSTESVCILKADGTFRVNLQAGDLFWMPYEKNIENGAFLSAKMIENNNQYNKGELAAGIAYDIEAGENAVWGDDDDSLINAHTQTSWRRRICSSTVAGRNTSQTMLGVQSSNTLEEDRRNDAYKAWGDRWAVGNITNYSLSINDEGQCYVSFMNENNVEMTWDYYAIDEAARKVMDGPIGFYAFWDGDGNNRGYMTVEILELYAGGPDYAGVTDAAISLSLDGTIGLNFAFNAEGGVPAGSTIVATKNGVVVAEQAVVEGANLVTAPVAAKEMNDSVNFSIVSEGEVFDGHSYTTSVAEYAAMIMADDNYNEWDELIGAMLNYGAAAQKLLNYKADALAPGASAEVDFDFAGYEAISFSGDTSVLAGLYMNLSLESETTLKIYFKMADGTMPTVSVNGEAAELVDNGDGYWVLSIGDIAADKLDDDFAIVVNGGAVSFDVNALDWAKIASADADVNVANVAMALAAYGVAAGKKF